MKIHMYEDFPNFGDALNRHLWPRYFGRWLERTDDITMYGIGTLIGQDMPSEGRVIVCGSGCGYSSQIGAVPENCKVFFVRGPLSAKALGLPAEAAISDPAILTPELFAQAAPTGQAVFMPHWETAYNPLWQLACRQAGIRYVHPLDPVETVVEQLSGARLVIAEAMHGAIIADAYRVPWVPVITSERINRFKWFDWAESLGIRLRFHRLPSLGASDFFRHFTGNPISTSTLGEILNAYETDLSHIKRASLPKRAYNRLMHGPRRTKFDLLLLSRLGPILDSAMITGRRFSLPSRRMKQVVTMLEALGRESGTLSDADWAERQRTRLHERLREIAAFLEQA